ncbi:Manganese-transporting ATPase 1 [Cyphellophora attinorum]|uniref:Manganese-transporting ATPase 1 n=1 Tax=Cyphellophora attinorum TaxID=1664694 RepID=A0A0N1HBR6_9EURO|nr:Manganese-transporting ATPase 1 [Phialophora attinorum]KPI40875.1 Manganese-transporting ATPase 1 [Phialophora attinorum]
MAEAPSKLVNNEQIQAASLHNPRPLFLRQYVWPFTILWPIFLAVYTNEDLYDDYIDGKEWTFVWVATIATLQSLAWLSTKWSVSVATTFTTYKAHSVDEASLIKVIPITNSGTPQICKLEREADGRTSFLYQKRRFIYYPDKATLRLSPSL